MLSSIAASTAGNNGNVTLSPGDLAFLKAKLPTAADPYQVQPEAEQYLLSSTAEEGDVEDLTLLPFGSEVERDLDLRLTRLSVPVGDDGVVHMSQAAGVDAPDSDDEMVYTEVKGSSPTQWPSPQQAMGCSARSPPRVIYKKKAEEEQARRRGASTPRRGSVAEAATPTK